jgi:hypothetical protein
MQRISKVGLLGIVAAVLGMSFVGSAQATTLCKVSTNPCPESSRITENTELTGHLSAGTSATVKTNQGTVTCTKSNYSVVMKGTSAEPLPVDLKTMTLEGCTGGGYSCTTSSQHLPYHGSVKYLGEGDGKMTFPEGTGGKPGGTGSCGGVSCTFTAEPSFEIFGGSPGGGPATEVTLTPVSGSCSSGTFYGSYEWNNTMWVAQ